MDIRDLIKQYLQKPIVMQLATTSGDQPRICIVHFAVDDEQSLFWMSSPSTRHSREIAKNKKAAVTIPIQFPDNPVIGVQLEGDADAVGGSERGHAVETYDKKFNLDEGLKKRLLSGSGDGLALYRFKPRVFVLFDQVNFPDDPRQEWRLKESAK